MDGWIDAWGLVLWIWLGGKVGGTLGLQAVLHAPANSSSGNACFMYPSAHKGWGCLVDVQVHGIEFIVWGSEGLLS